MITEQYIITGYVSDDEFPYQCQIWGEAVRAAEEIISISQIDSDQSVVSGFRDYPLTIEDVTKIMKISGLSFEPPDDVIEWRLVVETLFVFR